MPYCRFPLAEDELDGAGEGVGVGVYARGEEDAAGVGDSPGRSDPYCRFSLLEGTLDGAGEDAGTLEEAAGYVDTFDEAGA